MAIPTSSQTKRKLDDKNGTVEQPPTKKQNPRDSKVTSTSSFSAVSPAVFNCEPRVGTLRISKSFYPESSFGLSKAKFEDDLIAQLEVYQTTLNKVLSITKKPILKSSKTANDLKILYEQLIAINVQASAKLKQLGKVLDSGREELKKHESQMGEDEDLKIVQPKAKSMEIVELLDSDDDEDDQVAPAKLFVIKTENFEYSVEQLNSTASTVEYIEEVVKECTVELFDVMNSSDPKIRKLVIEQRKVLLLDSVD